MSSYFTRLWQGFKYVSKRRLVGKDLQGNSFYETITGNDIDGSTRAKRTVEYIGPKESWRAAENMKLLPVQWTSWLTYSRQHPPTIEELVNDQLRQQKLAQNVERLKEQDEEERRRQMEAQARLRISAQQTQAQAQAQARTSSPHEDAEPVHTNHHPKAPPSKPIGPTAEPQTWIPSATQRGG